MKTVGLPGNIIAEKTTPEANFCNLFKLGYTWSSFNNASSGFTAR